MPRKANFTREDIVSAALEIVRKEGIDALSYRVLGKKFGASASPVLTYFKTMEDLHSAVRKEAIKVLYEYLKDCTDYVPAFKEYGIRLIRFAKEENNLYRLIYLNPEAASDGLDHFASICMEAMMKDYGLTEEQKTSLISQTWVYCCGLAMLTSSGAMKLTEDEICDCLGRQFLSVFQYIKSGKKLPHIEPHKRDADEQGLTLKIE